MPHPRSLPARSTAFRAAVLSSARAKSGPHAELLSNASIPTRLCRSAKSRHLLVARHALELLRNLYEAVNTDCWITR